MIASEQLDHVNKQQSEVSPERFSVMSICFQRPDVDIYVNNLSQVHAQRSAKVDLASLLSRSWKETFLSESPGSL
eukprot:745775-Hanusia_phi.AAC.1